MKLLYLLALALPLIEARPWATHQRFIRQAGRYGTSGAYRPNQAYSSSNNGGSVSSSNGNGNNANNYGNAGANNNNGNVRVAYAPSSAGPLAARPYNGVGGFKYGGRPAPGNEFVLNSVGGGGGGVGVGSVGGGGSSSGVFSLNQPKSVYKGVNGNIGRPQGSGAYRVGPPGGPASGGRPVAVGGSSYLSG